MLNALLPFVPLMVGLAGPPVPGPAVGSELPPFELRDQDGALRTFADLRGPNGLVLVFFRTADW